MIGIILGLPVLAGVVMLQSAVVSRLPLLNGKADLMLLVLSAWALHERVQSAWIWALVGGLMVGYLSSLPFGLMTIAYLAAVGLAMLIRRRIWRAPILAMFAAVFLGTLIVHLTSLLAVSLQGTLLPLVDVFNLITLPSLVLNLLLAAPVFVLVHDLANWAYPEEIEV